MSDISSLWAGRPLVRIILLFFHPHTHKCRAVLCLVSVWVFVSFLTVLLSLFLINISPFAFPPWVLLSLAASPITFSSLILISCPLFLPLSWWAWRRWLGIDLFASSRNKKTNKQPNTITVHAGGGSYLNTPGSSLDSLCMYWLHIFFQTVTWVLPWKRFLP